MKTQFTLAVLAFALAANTAFAANTMAPASGGMAGAMTASQPMASATTAKPVKHAKKPTPSMTGAMGAPASGGMMESPAATMAPANAMGGSH